MKADDRRLCTCLAALAIGLERFQQLWSIWTRSALFTFHSNGWLKRIG